MALPHSNATVHKPWASYYDLETFNIVKRLYRPDIETFGYPDDPKVYGIT